MSITEQTSRLLLLFAVIALAIAAFLAKIAAPDKCLAIGALGIHTTAFALRLTQPAVERFFSRSQPYLGPFILIACIILVINAIMAGFAAVAKLFLMLSSLLPIPFGIIVYLGMWGDFPRTEARILLSTLMMLVIVSGALQVFADLRVVRNSRLVIAYLFALVLVMVISIGHGFVPRIAASITDAIVAILLSIVGAVAAIRVGFSQIRPIRGLIEKIRA